MRCFRVGFVPSTEPSLAQSYRQGRPVSAPTSSLANERVDDPVDAHVRNPCGPDATGAPRDPTPGQAEDRNERLECQRVLGMRSGERDARQNRRRPEAEHRSQRGQEKSTKDELLVEVREEIGRSNPWIELGCMNCTWLHAGENAERRGGADASNDQAPDHDGPGHRKRNWPQPPQLDQHEPEDEARQSAQGGVKKDVRNENPHPLVGGPPEGLEDCVADPPRRPEPDSICSRCDHQECSLLDHGVAPVGSEIEVKVRFLHGASFSLISCEPCCRVRGLMRSAVLCLCLLAAPSLARGQVDSALAQSYFHEAAALCERDGGKLWGVSLCGPMVFADAATKTIATSQPAPEAPHPKGLGFLNAPVTWGGTRWSAYVWALVRGRDERERGVLFIHELFHRIQSELKLMAGAGETDHLDTLEGRYWMQLEWRALSRALTTSGETRAAAIRDALAFRRARRTEFPATGTNEAADEINEGLAEYTGV